MMYAGGDTPPHPTQEGQKKGTLTVKSQTLLKKMTWHQHRVPVQVRGKKRKRKQKFSTDELRALAEAVQMYKRRLYGPHASRLTSHERDGIWNDIATRVNAVGHGIRSGINCRKRWNDVRREAKSHEAHHRRTLQQTGGGPPSPERTSVEHMALATLSEEQISGVGHEDTEDRGSLFSVFIVLCAYMEDKVGVQCPNNILFPAWISLFLQFAFPSFVAEALTFTKNHVSNVTHEPQKKKWKKMCSLTKTLICSIA